MTPPKPLPRGIRMNNPGNIDQGPDEWQGEVHPSRDPRFMTFTDMAHGVRAAAIIFRNYEVNKGLLTITQKIGRWAPPIENPTKDYANFVAHWCGISPDKPFLVAASTENMRLLLQAVFHVEDAGDFVSDTDLRAGIKLALRL